MLDLSNTTLVIYDPMAPKMAAEAVLSCVEKALFGEVQIWSTSPFDIARKQNTKFFPVPPDQPKDLGQQLLWNEIPKHIKTDFVLNIEWDGFIRDEKQWKKEFFEFDFIGAPWSWHNKNENVGNGGFSLLSTRLLKTLCNFNYTFPWDTALCRYHRPRLESLGFRWAPSTLAEQFSLEWGKLRPSFGFHDCRNFPRIISPTELRWRTTIADDYIRAHPSWNEMLNGVSLE
jgi:hypothetical protein